MRNLTRVRLGDTMPAVEDLLTAKQLQDLLKVDRITIYRMLSDGRLTGFKVGGQWRFSRRQIESWLQERQTSPEAAPEAVDELPSDSQALPLHCVQAIQSIYAEALDVAAVTTNPDGTPLTYVSNSCAFCDLILATEEGRRRCTAAWSRLAEPGWRASTERPGQLRTCHAGLLCASAPVQVGGQWMANFAACQFVAQPLKINLPALATDLGLAESDLQAAAASIRRAPEPTMARILGLVEQVAVTLGQIGQERLGLVSRLRRIAEITNL